MKKITPFLPGIIFNLVALTLIAIYFNAWNISGYLPKYYAGDPDFDITRYTESAYKTMESQNLPYIDQTELQVVLPPKVIPHSYSKWVNMIPLILTIWLLSWNIYAISNKKNFPSYNLVAFGSIYVVLFLSRFLLKL